MDDDPHRTRIQQQGQHFYQLFKFPGDYLNGLSPYSLSSLQAVELHCSALYHLPVPWDEFSQRFLSSQGCRGYNFRHTESIGIGNGAGKYMKQAKKQRSRRNTHMKFVDGWLTRKHPSKWRKLLLVPYLGSGHYITYTPHYYTFAPATRRLGELAWWHRASFHPHIQHHRVHIQIFTLVKQNKFCKEYTELPQISGYPLIGPDRW